MNRILLVTSQAILSGFAVLLLLLSAASTHAEKPVPTKPDPECSLARTNRSCWIIIDRSHLFAPPTLQMFPRAKVTVWVKNPRYFERYFLDYQSSQITPTPDVASAVVNPLLTPLAKLGEFQNQLVENVRKARTQTVSCDANQITLNQLDSSQHVRDNQALYLACLVKFSEDAKKIYSSLELVASPDAFFTQAPTVPISNANASASLGTVTSNISDAVNLELALSGSLSLALKNAQALPPVTTTTVTTGVPATTTSGTVTVTTPTSTTTTTTTVSGTPGTPSYTSTATTTSTATYDNSSIEILEQLNALRTIADAIATDLFGYSTRIADLPAPSSIPGQVNCSDLKTPYNSVAPGSEESCLQVAYSSDKPDTPTNAQPFSKQLIRQIAFSLDSLNWVANSREAVPTATLKKALSPITIVFGDSRWEPSAGALFSTLPIRSFAVSPVYNSSGTVTDKQITTSVLRPTVVPFAAANFRVSRDLDWSRWRMAWYATGAVGINPNTLSADFAAGPSLSFRGLVFSALWHYGHDVRLTQGLYVGESLEPVPAEL